MRALACAWALLVVLAPATARAGEPQRHVYGWLGYRAVAGLPGVSSPSLGAGYRLARRGYGFDAALLNVQLGRATGLNTALRLSAYAELDRVVGADVWIGGGVSYGWANAWTDSALPQRSGHGFQLDLLAGYELVRVPDYRLFVQLAVTAPLYKLRDGYASRETEIYAWGGELGVGLGF